MGDGTVAVLVVDDDPAVRSTSAAVLRGAGYSVTEAADGIVALSAMSALRFDCIVLDVDLPHLNGLELLDALIDPPPTLLVTGRPFDAEVWARRTKVFAFLRKPVLPADLLDKVHRALSSQHR
jgi:two-component system chemotaxis response regulator CheY